MVVRIVFSAIDMSTLLSIVEVDGGADLLLDCDGIAPDEAGETRPFVDRLCRLNLRLIRLLRLICTGLNPLPVSPRCHFVPYKVEQPYSEDRQDQSPDDFPVAAKPE